VHPLEFAVYAALGVVGGLGSVAFVKLLLGIRARFLKMPKWTVWFQPVAGGLGVGLMGFFIPEVLGVGYDIVDKALNGDLVLSLLVLLAVLKIVATALCYGSGNAGGIFGPSLFIGAMIGGSVGSVAHAWLPGYTAEPGAYALVGMGTAFAGIVRTPLTSVIMIFEVTRDYTIIVPLMISNLIAFFISHKLQKQPIYEALAHQDGVSLPTSESRAQAARIQVSHAMRPVPDVLPPDLSGIPSLGSPEHPTDAAALPYAHVDDSLSVVLERMGSTGRSVLPVVSRADTREVIGIVTLADILKAYGVATHRPSGLKE
jgi:CIC family chloride channel protein